MSLPARCALRWTGHFYKENDMADRTEDKIIPSSEEKTSSEALMEASADGHMKEQRKPLQLPPRARRFCAFVVGVVFFLSGVMKLMDPVGTGLIMGEYYKFFHVGFLMFSAKAAGVLLAFIETMAGVALITGVWRRFTAWVVTCFLAFFTLLTLILLIFNPEMDCGCFGEAVHLTHLQSFLKNIVLDILVFAAFWPFKSFGRNKRRKYVAFSLVSVAVVALMLYSVLYIPLLDFTGFKPGIRLAAADFMRHIDADDMYESVFVYEKDGRQEQFTLEDLPDSTWTFVRTETVMKARPEDELMQTLSFYDTSGEYRDTLAVKGAVMCVTVYHPEKMSAEKWERTSVFVTDAMQAGFTPLLLTASSPSQIVSQMASSGVEDNVIGRLLPYIYFCDYKTVISVNRSNCGVTYFDRGYLVKKWPYSSIPDAEDLQKQASGDATETLLVSDTAGSLMFQGFLLYSFAVMLLL